MEIACALADEPEGPDLLADAGAVWPLLRAFSIAWDMPASALQLQLLQPSSGPITGSGTSPPATGDPREAAEAAAAAAAGAAAGTSPPFQFSALPSVDGAKRNHHPAAGFAGVTSAVGGRPLLQDHQGREQVLDAMLLLLRHPAGLAAVGAAAVASSHATASPRTSAAVGLAAFQLHSPSQGPAPGCLGRCAVTCRCGHLVSGLRLLHGLVLALLQRATPAHIRSALALLGAVRCAAAATSPPAPPASGRGEDGVKDQGGSQGQDRGRGLDRAKGQDEGLGQGVALAANAQQQVEGAQQGAEEPKAHRGQQSAEEQQAQETQLASARAAVLRSLTALLELLCDVFDVAWAAETDGAIAACSAPPAPPSPSPQAAAAAAAAAIVGPVATSPPSSGPHFGVPQVSLLSSAAVGPGGGGRLSASGGTPVFGAVAPSLGRASTSGTTAASAPVTIPSSSSRALCVMDMPGAQAGHQGLQGQLSAGAAAGAGGVAVSALTRIDVGVGYRVLVQVLQAWRQLSNSGDPGVAAALSATCWWQRVTLARLHDRPQVTAAAEQVKWREGALPVAPSGAVRTPGPASPGLLQVGQASASRQISNGDELQGGSFAAALGQGIFWSGGSFPDIEFALGDGGEGLQQLPLGLSVNGHLNAKAGQGVHLNGDQSQIAATAAPAAAQAAAVDAACSPIGTGASAATATLYLARGASQPLGASAAPVGLHAILPLGNGHGGSLSPGLGLEASPIPQAPQRERPENLGPHPSLVQAHRETEHTPEGEAAGEIAAAGVGAAVGIANAGGQQGAGGFGDGNGSGLDAGLSDAVLEAVGAGEDEEMMDFLSAFLQEPGPDAGATEGLEAGQALQPGQGWPGVAQQASEVAGVASVGPGSSAMESHWPVAAAAGDSAGATGAGARGTGSPAKQRGELPPAGAVAQQQRAGLQDILDSRSPAAAADDLFQPWDGALPEAGALPMTVSGAAGGAAGAQLKLGADAPARVKTEEQLVAEAMSFLPDLDAIAEQLCVKYDIVELPAY